MTDKDNALTGDNGQPLTGSETPTETTTAMFNESTPLSEFPPAIQEYVRALRTESRARKEALRASEKAAKDAEAKRLTEQGEYKTLAETRLADLERLQPIAEQHEAITAAFNASLDNRLKQIPEDVRKKAVDPVRATMTPVAFSNWLDANLETFAARRAPGLDGGAGTSAGSKGGAATLTADDLEMAKAMNIKPDDWAKRKAELAAIKANPRKE